LLKTQVTMWNRDFITAKQSIDNALSAFEQLELAQLESMALVEMSWVHLVNQEFRQGMQVLNQAASKARTSHEPLQEVTAHRIQSFMASKAGEVELSHTQLSLAKELIELHRLGDEHQVPILNNSAWIAESPDEKLRFSQQILDMPFSAQYESSFYVAAENLRFAYIERQQWDNALATIKPWQRKSFQQLSQAHIAFAQGYRQLGMSHAIDSHRQAQTDHQLVDALDAALLLLQHHDQGGLLDNPKQYQTFIESNATNRWRDQNRQAWQQLTTKKAQ